MKLAKLFFFFLLTLSIVSCKKDDDSTEQFLLTKANLAGSHSLTYFTVNIDQIFEINGIPTPSNISIIGDTFQVIFVFNENGTYTSSGQYRIVTTTTVGGNSETDSEIIVLDNSGTYQLDANTQTITFGGGNGNLGNGVFNVDLFNSSNIYLTQSLSQNINTIPTDSQTEIRFARE